LHENLRIIAKSHDLKRFSAVQDAAVVATVEEVNNFINFSSSISRIAPRASVCYAQPAELQGTGAPVSIHQGSGSKCLISGNFYASST
jgi:hypothetical protein